MSNKKISEDSLLAAGSIDGDADYIPVVDVSEASAGSRNKRSLLKSIADWVIQTAASFVQSGSGAVARTAQSKMREVISVFDFMTTAQIADVQAGTVLVDCTAALQAAIDAVFANGGGILFFPRGSYRHNSQLTFKNRIQYIGEGMGHTGTYQTRLYYTGASDNIVVSNPINSTTEANYAVRHMTLMASTATAGKACFADVGSHYVEFDNVAFLGNSYGLILDQSIIVGVRVCDFASTLATAGLWLVNGDDHTPGAATYYTNRITVDGCQFNMGAAAKCVIDDGGTAHTFTNNNFNAGTTQLRIAGVRNITIEGNEFEGCTVHAVLFADNMNSGEAIGATQTARLNGNFFTGSTTDSAPHDALVDFESNSLLRLEMMCNAFSLNSGGANPVTSPTSFVNWITAGGNYNEGTGAQPYNNLNQNEASGLLAAYAPVWTDAGTPTLGDGTLTGTWWRNGVAVTASGVFTWGSTTAVSGGIWFLSLPIANGEASVINGTWYAIDSGGNRYDGACYLAAGDAKVQFLVNGATASISGTVPFAWAAGDILGFTITYPAKINN